MSGDAWGFTSMMSTLKEKSQTAMSTLTSDLQEFSSVVKSDVKHAAKEVKQNLDVKNESKGDESSNKPAASLFTFGSNIIENLGSSLLQGAGELVGGSETDEQPVASGKEFRLLALQKDESTYLTPPTDSEAFKTWTTSVSEDDRKQLIDDIIEHYPIVQEALTRYVPDRINEQDFWSFYLYKASQLTAQELRAEKLFETANDSEDELDWGDEDEDDQVNEQVIEIPVAVVNDDDESDWSDDDDDEIVKAPVEAREDWAEWE